MDTPVLQIKRTPCHSNCMDLVA